jgi:hypothetical protein
MPVSEIGDGFATQAFSGVGLYAEGRLVHRGVDTFVLCKML